MQRGSGGAKWVYQIAGGSDIIPLLLDHVRLFVWISIRLLFLLLRRGFPRLNGSCSALYDHPHRCEVL
jgi:hypothetical protein